MCESMKIRNLKGFFQSGIMERVNERVNNRVILMNEQKIKQSIAAIAKESLDNDSAEALEVLAWEIRNRKGE